MYLNNKNRYNKQGKLIKLILSFFVIIILIGGVLLLKFGDKLDVSLISCYLDSDKANQEYTINSDKDTIEFEITSGETPYQIANKLYKQGIIPDANYFYCYLKKQKLGGTIQAGYFEIPKKTSMAKIANILQKAKASSITVTVPEGLRADEIADIILSKLSEKDVASPFNKNEFLKLIKDKDLLKQYAFLQDEKTAEGYLFPDTYEIEATATTQDIIKMMLDNFNAKVVVPLYNDFTDSKLSMHDAIVLASIIEKEAGKDYKEKQMISGILQKRLANGWTLDVDATLLYHFKDWKHPITVQDKLTVSNHYNTYKYQGLPPTPICNPGKDSIKAALHPVSSDYWYYLHDKNGKIHYSKTLDEHNLNINKYLR